VISAHSIEIVSLEPGVAWRHVACLSERTLRAAPRSTEPVAQIQGPT